MKYFISYLLDTVCYYLIIMVQSLFSRCRADHMMSDEQQKDKTWLAAPSE